MTDSQISTLIKSFAKSKGITLKEISKKIGITEQGLYTSFQNNSIKVSTLQKIADVLEVDIREFFGGNYLDLLQSQQALISSEIDRNGWLRTSLYRLIRFLFSNTYYSELINNFVATTDYENLQVIINRRILKYKPYQHGYFIPDDNETIINIINYCLFEYPPIAEAFEKKKVKNTILQAQYDEWKKNPPKFPDEKED